MFITTYQLMAYDNKSANTGYSKNIKHNSKACEVLLEKKHYAILFNDKFLYIDEFISQYGYITKKEYDSEHIQSFLKNNPEFLNNMQEYISLFLKNIEKIYYDNEIDNQKLRFDFLISTGDNNINDNCRNLFNKYINNKKNYNEYLIFFLKNVSHKILKNYKNSL